ncbi:MAG: DUF3375 family protein [Gammaproteobacteria bacterium]|nr:DUF3375 family protein [Gammaproteobacteria bacterium]
MHSSNFTQLRQSNPAWLLLAATKGPLLIAVLQALFNDDPKGIELEMAVLKLAQLLREEKQKGTIECSDDFQSEAQREIRKWIKRSLLQERKGVLLTTDALESAMRFVLGLGQQRIMSSSASRLAIVQREVEHLEASLNPNPEKKSAYLRSKIKQLEDELEQVELGNMQPMPEPKIEESIKEIYSLSTSLFQDFRRVEDSYKEADRKLRKSIISEQNHRGEIVDKLLDSHDSLLLTDEGKVFNSFYQQLGRKPELEKMKYQLRYISNHKSALKALNADQQTELRLLIMNLIDESGRVIKARSHSEKDVRNFLKSGLAAEHHRVGQLLQEVFAQASKLNWNSQKTRRSSSPLEPVAIANNGLALIERLRFKEWSAEKDEELALIPQAVKLDELDEEFWHSFDGLNQSLLLNQTTQVLAQSNGDMSIKQLAQEIPPSHDLETITFWLRMAMASDAVDIKAGTEKCLIAQEDGKKIEFEVPQIKLNSNKIEHMEFDL